MKLLLKIILILSTIPILNGCKKEELPQKLEQLEGDWVFVEGQQLTGHLGATIYFPEEIMTFEKSGKYIIESDENSEKGRYFITITDNNYPKKINIIYKSNRIRFNNKCEEVVNGELLENDTLILFYKSCHLEWVKTYVLQ